ncbi:MAG: hypothetical protein Q7J73_03685 [Dehalococcoidales bacterium]|nr:hypothetical protein [Dehalococcoidales bacterium]
MKHRDKVAHLILVAGFIVGLAAFFQAGPGQNQFVIVLSMTVYYLVWGFTYHHLRRDINAVLLLEYLAIAAIASVVNVIIFAR